MVEARDFSFSFEAASVLRGLSFHLPCGAYLSVIGPNGAGKSTLLKCLLRLHTEGRVEGEIRIKGLAQAAYGQRDLARVMAYVPQAGGWIPPFTVEQFASLSRYPHTLSPSVPDKTDREAVAGALRRTGMESLARRLLKTLSGGERQKAFLAAALAQGGEVLLLDEPASFLDPRHAAELHALLRALHGGERLTMITVTHDINHPLSMGGYALVLREGRRLFFGPAEELPGSGILEEAYGHRFLYLAHPRTGRPLVLAE